MSEPVFHGDLPSSPAHARELFELAQVFEDARHDGPLHVTIESIPEVIEEQVPEGVVVGHTDHPHSFEVFRVQEQADATSGSVDGNILLSTTVLGRLAATTDCEITANVADFKNDAALFPHLAYRQTAEIVITKRQDAQWLPVVLTTVINYGFFVGRKSGFFIDRYTILDTEPNAAGHAILERQADERTLLARLDAELDSPKPDETSVSFEQPEDDTLLRRATDKIFIPDTFTDVVPTWEGSEHDLRIQAELLEKRLEGKGIVSVAEAEALMTLLSQAT